MAYNSLQVISIRKEYLKLYNRMKIIYIKNSWSNDWLQIIVSYRYSIEMLETV